MDIDSIMELRDSRSAQFGNAEESGVHLLLLAQHWPRHGTCAPMPVLLGTHISAEGKRANQL